MSTRSWIIGSSMDCDIRVQSATVSGTHCRLTERGESFLLEDLQSSNGVFVAGERITGQCIVRRGDQVTLGKSVPLPWPATITIGRLPDNTIPIDLDTVSGHHACLERAEGCVYLIDLGSTNGTAINDPLNKISRAPIYPQDFVFFGAHRMSAKDLLSVLPPEPARQATALEQPRPAELAQAVPPIAEIKQPEPTVVIAQPGPPAHHSLRSWLGGIAISAAVVVVLFGGARLLRSPPQSAPIPGPVPSPGKDKSSASIVPPHKDDPAPAPTPIPKPAPPDEKLVRRSEAGVALVGVRLGDKLFFTKVMTTIWACGPRQMICPTAMLERLSGNLEKQEGNSESLVICAPSGPIAILDYRKGVGIAAGFSVATLESDMELACATHAKSADFSPAQGQQLAVLIGESENDDPKTISRKFAYLTIDRIDRSDDKLPLLLVCTAGRALSAAAGAPVFDASGAVVGCVQSVDDKSRRVEVVPLSRLASLFSTSP